MITETCWWQALWALAKDRMRVTWQLDSLPRNAEDQDPRHQGHRAECGMGRHFLAGTLVMTFQYASTGAFYCPASTVKGSVAGTPA